jgi:hypothetical protein
LASGKWRRLTEQEVKEKLGQGAAEVRRRKSEGRVQNEAGGER